MAARSHTGRVASRQPVSITASQAKNEFGRVLERVIRGGAVVITKHDAPKAVLISFEDFQVMSAGSEPSLDVLDREFDALLARMQTPRARRAMTKGFAASGKAMGKAAVAAVRGRVR